MRSTYKTHIGWVRQVNEDSGKVIALDDNTVLAIVADGMGGHRAGDVASKMAIEIIESSVQSTWRDKKWEEVLQEAVETANRTIYEHSQTEEALEGMGTTVEVGIFTRTNGLIAHVGDSRTYLYQKPILRQLTEDHSLVYALYKNGQITSDEAKTHPQKNVILRALGTEANIEIDFLSFTWRHGDKIMLCTDGLSNYVGHDQLVSYLSKSLSVQELGDQLLELSLDLGGDDNITFILIENLQSSSEGGVDVCPTED